jgi:hypothetical protein
MKTIEPEVVEVLRVMAGRFKFAQATTILEQVVEPDLVTSPPKKEAKRYTPYTSEQADFIIQGYSRLTLPELHAAYNLHFDETRSLGQIRCFLHNRRILSGRTGQFEKGSVSWNKGKKGYMGPNATSFKKGQLPHNHTRLWTERISKDGYIEISIPERNPYTGFPQRYKLKHIWLWEMHNGPVPSGHALIFKDGNRQRVELENLMIVTRSELLSLNLHKYSETPDELKPTVLQLAKLEAKAGIRTRPARGRKKRRA